MLGDNTLRMKQIVLSLILMFVALYAHASTTSVDALLLHRRFGNITIMLDEQPVITFGANELVVKTHMNVVRYPASEVLKFTYVDANSTNIIALEKENVRIALDDNFISIYNLPLQDKVMIYSVDGKLLASSKVDSHGKVRMKIPAKTNSVFLVKTLSLTFKIGKP